MDIPGALFEIEKRIPDNLRLDLRRRVCTATAAIVEIGSQLKKMVISNSQIREVLFNNNEDLIYFSGDILSRTFYEFYSKDGDLEEIFKENLDKVKFTQNIN